MVKLHSVRLIPTLLDRSHVLIDVDDTAGDYTCRVEAPLDLDAVPVE